MPLVPLILATVLIWFLVSQRNRVSEPNQYEESDGPSLPQRLRKMQNPATTLARHLDRRPLLPAADRPPRGLPRINPSAVRDDYIADGMRGIQIHLMQAARGGGWAVGN